MEGKVTINTLIKLIEFHLSIQCRMTYYLEGILISHTYFNLLLCHDLLPSEDHLILQCNVFGHYDNINFREIIILTSKRIKKEWLSCGILVPASWNGATVRL